MLVKSHFGLDVIFCCGILATNLYENHRLYYRLKSVKTIITNLLDHVEEHFYVFVY